MRLFPIHIFIKDFTFFIIYNYLLKWNVINRLSELNDMQRINGIKRATFLGTLESSVYYFMFFGCISFVLYVPIVYLFRWLIKNKKLNLIVSGSILTAMTPLLFWSANGFKHNNYYLIETEIATWIIVSLLSMTFYLFVNFKPKDFPCFSILLKK